MRLAIFKEVLRVPVVVGENRPLVVPPSSDVLGFDTEMSREPRLVESFGT